MDAENDPLSGVRKSRMIRMALPRMRKQRMMRMVLYLELESPGL
jgi:hypothetical protein